MSQPHVGRRALMLVAAACSGLVAGCTAPTTLPQIDGGERVPDGAVKVHFVELVGGPHVVVLGPGDDRPRARMALESSGYFELLEFIAAELDELELEGGRTRESPVVILSEGSASASHALGWLADPYRTIGWDGEAVRGYIGVGDLLHPRMVEAPRWLRERSDAPLFTLLLDSPEDPEPVSVCIPPPEPRAELMGRCVTLIDDDMAPSMPPGWPQDPVPAPEPRRIARQLCDALGEPFDIAWNGDSLEELAQLLVDDPRPAVCRGDTWLGHPNAAFIRTLRPREVPGWDEVLDRRPSGVESSSSTEHAARY